MRAGARGNNRHDVMRCIGRFHGYIIMASREMIRLFIQWTLGLSGVILHVSQVIRSMHSGVQHH